MKNFVALLIVTFFCGALASPASAQPMQRDEVPDALAPWIPWVMHGQTSFGCLKHGEEIVCGWPSELSLRVTPEGGSFVLSVVADRETDVALPGEGGSFPRDVRVDGRPAVIKAGAHPAVTVAAGTHRIDGTFAWQDRPETLPAPASIALVRLELDGAVVENVRRDDEGSVWLARRVSDAMEADALNVEVYRRIADGNPVRVTTVLRLAVSGRAREISLGKVTLEGSTPIGVSSPIPIRLSPAGELVVQAVAGSHEVSIDEVLPAGAASLHTLGGADSWPGEELWAIARDEAQRQVELDNAQAIDPARTNLPAQWAGLSAYVVPKGGVIAVRTVRRGDPHPQPNELTLHRALWLDIDGSGFTAQDTITGTMRQGFRLDFAGGELGRVQAGGRDQTITRGAENASGVELRAQDLNVVADWRKTGNISSLPAVGWSEDVQSLHATLHLPPAWRLIAARGVDEAPGAWIKQWTLWGVFFVLVIAVAFARTYGLAAGLLALATLVLIYHENSAPLTPWLVIVLLIALERAFSEGLLKSAMGWLWRITALVLVLNIVVFAAERARFAIHPASVSNDSFSIGDFDRGFEDIAETVAVAPAAPVAMEQRKDEAPAEDVSAEASAGNRRSRSQGAGGLIGRAGSYMDSAAKTSYRDPNAVVQTGPGLPSWSWEAVSLSWNGPVQKGETIGLVLLAPWATRSLAVLDILLVFGLAWFVWKGRPAAKAQAGGDASRAVAVVAVAMLALFGSRASAQGVPSQEMLDQLRSRLSAPAACGSECVIASEVIVDARESALVLELELHAAAAGTIELPGPVAAWQPSRVTMDGAVSPGLVRLQSTGFLVMRVPEGVHRVRLEGSLVGRDVLLLSFAKKPARATARTDGWHVEGIEEGRPGETLTLSRERRAEAAEGAGSEVVLPSWIEITRTVRLGAQWTIETNVSRAGSGVAPLSIRLARLAGEAITSPEATLIDNEVVVALGAGETSKRWSSRLDPADAIVLSAPTGEARSESWKIECGPIWHCDYEGLSATLDGQVEATERNEAQTFRRFDPWPGETLNIHVARPVASAGQTRTIDNASLEVTFGSRILNSKLMLTVRASTSGSETIALPANATIRSLQVNGESRAIQMQDGRLVVAIAPGESRLEIAWQSPFEWSPRSVSPRVELSSGAVNVRVNLALPEDRWLLWTFGPSWGPHVHFWGYFVLVLAFAALLSRVRGTGMSLVDWALLGLGLTQIPVWASAIVVGWFLLMAQRTREPNLSANAFNLRQILLVMYTLPALVCLFVAVHRGLLLAPDMNLSGGSPSSLSFYADRIAHRLPEAGVISLPMWAYRVVMLVWSLWLALRIVGWAKFAWTAFSEGGAWKTVVTPPQAPNKPEPAPVVPVDPSVPAARDAETEAADAADAPPGTDVDGT